MDLPLLETLHNKLITFRKNTSYEANIVTLGQRQLEELDKMKTSSLKFNSITDREEKWEYMFGDMYLLVESPEESVLTVSYDSILNE